MPSSKHYWSGQTENDKRAPDLTLVWPSNPGPNPSVQIAVAACGHFQYSHDLDRSSLTRLIKDLKRARKVLR